MKNRPSANYGFFEVLLGLTIEPRAMARLLLLSKEPPHGVATVALFLMVLLAPVLAVLIKGDIPGVSVRPVVAVSALVVVTISAFVMFESWLLLLTRVDSSINHLIACTGYSFAPLTLGVLTVHAVDFCSSGQLSLVRILLTGRGEVSPLVISLLPYIAVVAYGVSSAVFVTGLRALGELSTLSAIFTGVLSLIPFYAALVLGLLMALVINRDTADFVLNIFINPDLLKTYQWSVGP